jgi:hypothetical protein
MLSFLNSTSITGWQVILTSVISSLMVIIIIFSLKKLNIIFHKIIKSINKMFIPLKEKRLYKKHLINGKLYLKDIKTLESKTQQGILLNELEQKAYRKYKDEWAKGIKELQESINKISIPNVDISKFNH